MEAMKTVAEKLGFNPPNVNDDFWGMRAFNLCVSLQERVDVLEKALREVTTAGAFPEDCKHDEEPWYCDSCRVEWEKELSQAMTNADAALSPKEEVK